jgi:hypothetical protein
MANKRQVEFLPLKFSTTGTGTLYELPLIFAGFLRGVIILVSTRGILIYVQ